MYLIILLAWFLLLGCLGLQVDLAPANSHVKLFNSGDEDYFRSNVKGFIQNYAKVKDHTSGAISTSDLTQTQLHSSAQKELGRNLKISAAGADYVYGGGNSERVDEPLKSGTSEFKINTGFNIGLRWRPIRTKQKIKKLLYYFPKMFLEKTRSLIEKKVLDSKGGYEEYNGGDYIDDNNYDNNGGYDDIHYDNDKYDADHNIEDSDVDCENDDDQGCMGEYYLGEAYLSNSQSNGVAHRIKVYGQPSVSSQGFKGKKIKTLQQLKKMKGFLPQSLEYSSPRGSMIEPVDHKTMATKATKFSEGNPTNYEVEYEVNDSSVHSSNGNSISTDGGGLEAQDSKENSKSDNRMHFADSSNQGSTITSFKKAKEEIPNVDPNEVDWLQKNGNDMIVDAEAPKPSSNDKLGHADITTNYESLIQPSEQEHEPEYVLVDNSILVNEICPHMPNHFRSSSQEPGKSEEVLVTVFRQPTSSRLKASRPQYEGSFFPTNNLFASSSQAARIRLQDLVMWILFTQFVF